MVLHPRSSTGRGTLMFTLWRSQGIRGARLIGAAVTIAAGCSAQDQEFAPTEELEADALLHSKTFATGVVPFAVAIQTPQANPAFRSACTASRVGERLLLTAAHCVSLQGPAYVFVQSETGLQEERFELEERLVFPSTFGCWSAAVSNEEHVACVYKFPDVALVRTKNPLPARFSVAKVDARPVEFGESITQVGAGTSVGADGQRQRDDKLRLGPSYVARFSWLYPPRRTAQGVSITVPSESEALVFYAPGRNFGGRTLVQTAPGDSGGPVVRKLAGTLSVVGLHSTSGSEAEYSSEARLDDTRGVAGWLQSNGVTVFRSTPPARRSCAVGATPNAALGFCVRDEDGMATNVVLASSLRPACEADRALPVAKQPIGLSRVPDCAQKGLPATLLHHWVFGL